MIIKRGDTYLADLSPIKGSEQGGQRPVVIIQNDIGNKFSPTVIVAAISSKLSKSKLPTHVAVNNSEIELLNNSVVMLEQIRTIDKSRLIQKLGSMDQNTLEKINSALTVSLNMVL